MSDVALNVGDHVTVFDVDGNTYRRTIKAIHYPSTFDGEDCLIIRLEPTPQHDDKAGR